MILRNYNIKLKFIISRMEFSTFRTGLRIKNSLTGKLEQFIPATNNKVNWYTCGPTVYSHSHLGHARNYICNDIVRRIMKDYFGYDIKLVMNITDIEDKIIKNSIEEKVEFFEFAKKWENQFFQDMQNLNVEPADVITRVTEYVPQILTFITKIIDNGYAYQSNGSVYFDIEGYKKLYKYGKLRRQKESQTQAPQEMTTQKKNKDDFVLWKKAKQGQPTWDSPWGKGRPGWHIECSAMASSIFGSQMDIHSGGIDLVFPHHENELAQSEAFFCKQHWVKYFIHVGHLHIEGLKMSKSLKNFITIKQILKRTTARILRLFFAMHQYDTTLNIEIDPHGQDAKSLKEASEKDKRYKDFFSFLRSTLRDLEVKSDQKWEEKQFALNTLFQSKKARIHHFLCENIDSGNVFTQLDEIIKAVNIYANKKDAKFPLLNSVNRYLNKIFGVFGLQYGAEDKLEISKEVQYMNIFTRFRDTIRANAKTDPKTLLEICDKVRDYDLVEVGIRLEDRKIGEPSLWKQQSKEVLLKERQNKIDAQKKKEQEEKKKQQQKLNKMKINPREMFKTVEYTQWDQEGLPTHKKVKETEQKLNEKARIALKKKWDEQQKLYQQYLKIIVEQK